MVLGLSNVMNVRFGWLLLSVCLFVLLRTTTLAQEKQIPGVVLDPNHSPVAAATITLTGPGFSQATMSDENGSFSFSEVPPAKLKLTVITNDFAKYIRAIEPADLGNVLDVELKLADITERVNITATMAFAQVFGRTPLCFELLLFGVRRADR